MEPDVSYQVVVHHEDDGSFWAEIPTLPGLFASGETMPELWDAVTEAMSLYLSSPGSAVAVTIANTSPEENVTLTTGQFKVLVEA